MNRKDFLYACGMALPLSWFGCTGRAISPQQTKRKEKFSFAFFTDVHLNPNDGKNSEEGLRKALRDAKARKVDFIWFGGDNVETDRFPKEDENAANALHARFRQIVDESGMECHFTIGNHDRFYFREGQKDESGYQLFEKYFGPSYHSFDHKGIHFIALNSMDPDKEVYLLCYSGNNCAKTGISVLKDAGFPLENLYIIENGAKDGDVAAAFVTE